MYPEFMCERMSWSSVLYRIPSILLPVKSKPGFDLKNMSSLVLIGKNWALRDRETQYFEAVSPRGKE